MGKQDEGRLDHIFGKTKSREHAAWLIRTSYSTLNGHIQRAQILRLTSAHGWQTAGIDPSLPSKISPRNEREARQSGLRLKA